MRSTRSSSEFTVASLFAGCGGFDLGFRSQSFRSLGAFDLDPVAVENYRSNLGGYIREADLLNGIPVEDSLRNVGVLIAGPPCQGFSTVGKRNLNDPRNALLPLVGTLSLRIRPQVIIVENVAGVVAGEHGRYWKMLEETLRHGGYRTTSIFCRATQFGMAQVRKRILLVAWNGGQETRFPLPNLRPKRLSEVLRDVENLPNHAPKRLAVRSKLFQIAQHIRPGQKLSNVRGGERSVHTWDIPTVFGSTTTEERRLLGIVLSLRRRERLRNFGDADPVSKISLRREYGGEVTQLLDSLLGKSYLRKIGDKYDLVCTYNGKFRRLQWGEPSCTVDTRFGDPRFFLHPDKHRGLTVREAARIQGFPDSYIFSGDETAQFRMVGNAVPPPVAMTIASYAAHLLGRCV